MKNRTYRSEALAAIHGTVEALYRVGAIDEKTMRRFDKACLKPLRQRCDLPAGASL